MPSKKRSSQQIKAFIKQKSYAKQNLEMLEDIISMQEDENKEVVAQYKKAIGTIKKNLNTKHFSYKDVKSAVDSVEGLNLLNTINSELTLRDLNNRIAFAKSQGDTGPVNTNLSNYEISQLIKTFNDLYKAGLIRETFSSQDYDSSRVGEFAKTVLSPEILEEISKKAENYHTPTWREKYGWDTTRTIDF